MALPNWLKSFAASALTPSVASTVAGVSVLMALASFVAIPWFLCRLPQDYLHAEGAAERGGIGRRVGRNVLGAVLLLLGLLMLVLPGQGILTIVVGLTLLDFPRKRRLVRRTLGRRRVLSVVNSIRERFGRPPLTTYAD